MRVFTGTQRLSCPSSAAHLAIKVNGETREVHRRCRVREINMPPGCRDAHANRDTTALWFSGDTSWDTDATMKHSKGINRGHPINWHPPWSDTCGQCTRLQR